MKEKQNNLFTIGVAAAIIFVFSIVDLFALTGPFFSKDGNAGSQAAPAFTLKRFLSGEYAAEYEDHVRRNFRNHDKWKDLRLDFQMALGKRDINGVYLGREDTLFEQHLSVDYTKKAEEDSLEYLADLADRLGARVMLVPSSDAVWTNRLFPYAGFYDQKAYLDRAREKVGEESWIDIYGVLQEHSDEDIYYRTDPHWTALGAYYGYYAWWQGSGKRFPCYYDPDGMHTVTDRFSGALRLRAGREVRADELKIFPETLRAPATVQTVGEDLQEGYYRENALEGEDPYEYFLGEETGLSVIRTGYRRQTSLLVIGDSYAAALLPLLAPHYGTIYLVNPELYDGDPAGAVEAYSLDGKLDALILCGVPNAPRIFRARQE